MDIQSLKGLNLSFFMTNDNGKQTAFSLLSLSVAASRKKNFWRPLTANLWMDGDHLMFPLDTGKNWGRRVVIVIPVALLKKIVPVLALFFY